jgi:hypothetical protein
MSRKVLKKIGVAAIVVFAIKGLVWLGLALILLFNGCRP